MTIIRVPRPPNSAMDPDRPVSSLLKTQILQLHEAELRLPVRQQTDTYVNAIQTEGEAAKYIQQVTATIHAAHADQTARRSPTQTRAKPRLEIAAMADKKRARAKTSTQKPKSRAKKKSKRARH